MNLSRPIFMTLSLASTVAFCAMKPCSLFSDGAVLQRDMPVPVWGTGDNGTTVTVKFQDQEFSSVVHEGQWMVRLKPMKARGVPETMTISDQHTVIKVNDILVGEVWICSGQSNMELPVSQCTDPEATIAASADPQLRLFNVPNVEPPPNLVGPIPELTTRWAECNPDTAANFSGVGYFFGQKLRETLKVPVGLINISFGGSNAALWMDGKTQTEVAGSGTYRNGWLYDRLLRPLQPYAMRGVIWYQGESDADKALTYRKAFPALIKNWRDDWQAGSFPFLFVQLTGFNFYKDEVSPEPQEQSTWAELREAQAWTAASVPNTAMVVTTDLGSPKYLHAPRKKEIGYRLAMAAEGMVYGKNTHYKFPTFQQLEIAGDRAIITFAAAGLAKQGANVTGFTVAGEDQKFHAADADIEGNKVVVSSPSVPKPVAVRFGWANYPVTNLFDTEGLPAAPFRTDDFSLIKCSKCHSRTGRGITNGICNECGGQSKKYHLPN